MQLLGSRSQKTVDTSSRLGVRGDVVSPRSSSFRVMILALLLQHTSSVRSQGPMMALGFRFGSRKFSLYLYIVARRALRHDGKAPKEMPERAGLYGRID